MNNQMPYGFMQDPFMNNNNNYRMLDERIDRLEKQVKRLDKRVTMLENNNYPIATPYNQNNYNNLPHNYSM